MSAPILAFGSGTEMAEIARLAKAMTAAERHDLLLFARAVMIHRLEANDAINRRERGRADAQRSIDRGAAS